MRLHRFIAQSGLTSRRKAEDLIKEGRVTVNGAPVTEMGVLVEEEDRVEVDGRPLSLPRVQTYLFNKPLGVVTTLSDPQGRRTVKDFFPSSAIGLKPVGRLDINTEGLMVLTNDGELASLLGHARHGVDKEYEAVVKGTPDSKGLERLRKGLWIEGGKTAPAQADLIGIDDKKGTATVKLVIHEGRKHQVRLMLAAIGHDVTKLKRVRIGPFHLKGLRPGEMRKLGQKEVEHFQKSVRK